MTEEETQATERPPGYPDLMLDVLAEASKERYQANAEEKGTEKAWLDDEARWHIWKACDELFQARDYAHKGDRDATVSHFADALNHMLFATEIVELRDRGGALG